MGQLGQSSQKEEDGFGETKEASRESSDNDSKKQVSEDYSMSFEADSDEKEKEFDSNVKEVDREKSDVDESVEKSSNNLSKNTPAIDVVIEEKEPLNENSNEDLNEDASTTMSTESNDSYNHESNIEDDKVDN